MSNNLYNAIIPTRRVAELSSLEFRPQSGLIPLAQEYDRVSRDTEYLPIII